MINLKKYFKTHLSLPKRNKFKLKYPQRKVHTNNSLADLNKCLYNLDSITKLRNKQNILAIIQLFKPSILVIHSSKSIL